MCYGTCNFEKYMGECAIDTFKFKNNYGYSPCLIGGAASCPEEEEWIRAHSNIIKSVIRRYYRDEEAKYRRLRDAFNI